MSSDSEDYVDYGDNFYESDDYGNSDDDGGNGDYNGGLGSHDADDDFYAAKRRSKDTQERLDGTARSENHGKLFTNRLHDIFLSKEHCDVTLETCTSSTKAHKIVLAANSDYFSAMFSTTCLESRNNVVCFKDNPYITSDGLSAILKYAYTGSLPFTEDSAWDILEAARYFLMDDVTKTCSKFISRKVKQDNCIWLSITAANFEIDALRKHIENFLIKVKVTMDNYLMVLESAIAINSDKLLQGEIAFFISNLPNLSCIEELLDMMDSKTLHSMIKSDKQGLFTGTSLMDFIPKWVERNTEDRSTVLNELIKSVNPLCFDEESLDSISKLPCIQTNERCRESIREVQLDFVALKEYSPRKEDRYLISIGKDVQYINIPNDSTVMLKGNSNINLHKQQNFVPKYYKLNSSLAIDDNKLFLLYKVDNNGMCPCYFYEPSRNVWKRLASLPGERMELSLVKVGSKVYGIGGFEDGYEPTDKVDVYDLTDNEWFTEIPLHRRFSSVQSVVLKDQIFVLGDDGEFFQYDPNGVQRQCSQPTSADHSYNHVLGFVGDCIYRFGNVCSDEVIVTIMIDRYDPVLNHWSCSTTCMPLEVNQCDLRTALAHGGEIFLVALNVNIRDKKLNDFSYRDYGSTLFRYNEGTNSIDLLADDVPINDQAAMVHIPKMFMDRLKATAGAKT